MSDLLNRGMELISEFCLLNNLPDPKVVLSSKSDWRFDCCAYYRYNEIFICPSKCAFKAGEAVNRNWNWPGSTTDRTEYGVLCHELGHHVDLYKFDKIKGSYSSDYSVNIRKQSRERPLTSYCPNDAEWFAEMFRLFLTNPDLLSLVRPKTYDILIKQWKPVIKADWEQALVGTPPQRIVSNLRKKI